MEPYRLKKRRAAAFAWLAVLEGAVLLSSPYWADEINRWIPVAAVAAIWGVVAVIAVGSYRN